MKQHKWLRLFPGFVLIALVLNACTFSVQVLSAPTSAEISPTAYSPELLTSITPTPTFTAVPFTLVAPSATPTLISIRDGTYYMLENFMNAQQAEIVHALAFSPDDSYLASAGGQSADFTIHIREVASGQEVITLIGHSDIIWGLAFSPDGRMLASVSSDKTVKIWDWWNGLLLKELNLPGEVASVSFSPDGQSLAVGGVDELENQIRNAAVWTFAVNSWQPLVEFREYMNVTALAYSPQGGTLVGGGTSRNVQVWRASDGASVYTLSHAHQVGKLTISPDGNTVATATCATVVNYDCTDGGIWLWDLPTGKLRQKLAGFPNIVVDVGFTADGSTLIAGSRDGTLRFYSTSDYTSRYETISPGGISAMALSPDSGLLATGGHNGEVNLWKNVYHP